MTSLSSVCKVELVIELEGVTLMVEICHKNPGKSESKTVRSWAPLWECLCEREAHWLCT